MPTQATTNLTIGTILDLIGQAQSTQPGGKDDPTFDALLQSPPPAPTNREPDARRSEPPEQERSQLARDFEPQQQRSESPAGASNEPAAPEEDDRPLAAEHEVADELQVVNAQDLTSREVAAVVVSVLPPVLPADAPASTQGSTDEAAATEDGSGGAPAPKKAVRRAARPGPHPATSVAGEARIPAIESQDAKLAPPSDQSSESSQQRVGTGAQSTLADMAGQPVDEQDHHMSPAAAHEDAMELGVSLPEITGLAAAESSSRHEAADWQANPDNQPSDLVPNAATAAPVDGAVKRADSAAIAVPVNVPQPIASQPAAHAVDSAAAAISTTAPRRAQLPSELLAHGAETGRRPASVRIDSEKLLTRVARALTAAQAREGDVRLRLSPPELGSLRLEIRVHDGAMVAHVEAETEAARTALVDNLPALRERLSEQGVRIERFDVDLMHKHAGGSANQSDQRQANEPPPPVRVALPRRISESPADAPLARPGATADGRLNVIV